MSIDMKAVKVLTTVSAEGVLHCIRVGGLVASFRSCWPLGLSR